MDYEKLVKNHTVILLGVGVFFALVQGIQYGLFATIAIIAAVSSLALFMYLTRKVIPLNIRIHIISNGSFFVAFGCSALIYSIPDMFGLFVACCIVSTLYFNKTVIIVMGIIVNATVVIGIYFLHIGMPEGAYSNLWFINNVACFNCALVLLYAVSSIGKGFIDEITRKSRETEELMEQVQKQSDTIMSGINYAGKIQRNLLPPEEVMSNAFSDHSIIWKPRDIVGGDVYWTKTFKTGTVLCVADCTGHGTPGALLTMLVTLALDSMVTQENCDDTASIMCMLDHKLSEVLHVQSESGESRGITDIDDGCDVALLFVSKDNSVRFSSGNIPVFVCDGTDVAQYKGQKLFIGEGKIKHKDEITIHRIPGSKDSKYYIASDGLFDQIGKRTSGSAERGQQYGYEAFKQIILENHENRLDEITAKVWSAYEAYRGDEDRRDDFELVAFKP